MTVDDTGRPSRPPGRPTRAECFATVEALLDLAYDASSYLRRSARPAVRLSAALLVAASLAACGPSPAVPSGTSVVQPLSSEVRSGLPTAPGRYPIVAGSLARDARGIYYFGWRRPGDPIATRYDASVSRVRLGQGATEELEIPAQGDPVLNLPADASIPLIASSQDWRSPSYGGYYSTWRPFSGTSYRGPAYYDPPAGTISGGGTINGAHVSSSPSSLGARTVSVSHAVSARAGGTGAGNAATNKSGASVSIDHGGVAAAKAASFSAGRVGSSAGRSSS